MERVHVYPTSLDQADLAHDDARYSVRVRCPEQDCALCQHGLCEQRADPTDLSLVMHGLTGNQA